MAIPVADATSTTTDVTDRAAAPAANTATVDTNSGQAAPSTNVEAAAADTSATTTDTNNATATASTDRAATTDTANTEARTRSRRALAETREANTNTATGIQWINGKQYYVNSDGSVRKNFVFEQDGKSYYFDAETGLLRPSHRMNFQQNLSRQLWIFHLEISSTKTITNLWTNSTPSSLRILGTVQRVFSRMVRLGQLQLKRTNVHS